MMYRHRRIREFKRPWENVALISLSRYAALPVPYILVGAAKYKVVVLCFTIDGKRLRLRLRKVSCSVFYAQDTNKIPKGMA